MSKSRLNFVDHTLMYIFPVASDTVLNENKLWKFVIHNLSMLVFDLVEPYPRRIITNVIHNTSTPVSPA